MKWITKYKIKNKYKMIKWWILRVLFPKYYWRKYEKCMKSLESENWSRMY